MNIGTAGEISNLPAKTIRYYESIGLLRPARQQNGYRDYSQSDVHKLHFLQRARSLGFSIKDCRTLLSLYEDKRRSSRSVKALAKTHLDRIDQKIAELEGMREIMRHLIDNCHGDDRPDCPILDDLADEGVR